MFDAIQQSSLRQTVFAIFVFLVFSSSAVEITWEFLDGETFATMWDDLLWVAVSAMLLGVFFFELRSQQVELKELRGQLQKSCGKLVQLDSEAPRWANQYRAVVQKQFDAWQLTNSEQDVVIGMLKGLSFKEIAELRETREKTVRQQASAAYRKAGVRSRNELVAWFFEDLLEPPAATSN